MLHPSTYKQISHQFQFMANLNASSDHWPGVTAAHNSWRSPGFIGWLLAPGSRRESTSLDLRQSSEREHELTDCSVLPECNLPAAYHLPAQPAAKQTQQHLQLQRQHLLQQEQQQQHSQTRQSHRSESGLPPSPPQTPEGRSKTLSAMATVLEGVASLQDQGRFPATRTRLAVPFHTSVFQSRDCPRSDYILATTKAAVHFSQGTAPAPSSSSTVNLSTLPAHSARDDLLMYSEGGDDDCVDNSHIDTSLTPSSLFEKYRPKSSSYDKTQTSTPSSDSALTFSYDKSRTRSSSYEKSQSRFASHDAGSTQSNSFEKDSNTWASVLGQPPSQAAASDGTVTLAASSSKQFSAQPSSFQNNARALLPPTRKAASSSSLDLSHNHHRSLVGLAVALRGASASEVDTILPEEKSVLSSLTRGRQASACAALAASSFLYKPTVGLPHMASRLGAREGGKLPGSGRRMSEREVVAVAPPHSARGGLMHRRSGGCLPIKEQLESSSRVSGRQCGFGNSQEFS